MSRLPALLVFAAALSVLTGDAGATADLPPGGTFFDDDASVHESSIEAIAAAGITRGCAEPDLFCPEDPVTRGQMAAFLRRGLGLSPGTSRFTDTVGSVFEADVAALAEAGITRGCAPGRFCPDDPVTRSQMAAFLVRAFDLPPNTSDPFTDDDGSVFESDISALWAAGLTRGCGGGLFCPDHPVTRAEMATFLTRALPLDPIRPPPRPTASIAFTGDTLIHMPLSERAAFNAAGSAAAYDFRPMFEPIRNLIEGADLAICHLEVPLSPTSSGLSGYPTFNAPAEVASALAHAGFDGCSTASNHSFDQRTDGVLDTISVLEDAGLGHAGTARSAAEADEATTYTLEELTVAHISATWWLNGFRLPSDRPWLVEEPLEVDRLVGLAEDAKRNGADFVVVSIHCCVEYVAAPTTQQVAAGRALLSSEAVDLVVGHHAHVVQPVERVGDEYLVYGLGNLISGQRRRSTTVDGVIVFANLALRGERWVTRSLEYVPTWVEGGTYRILPAAETIAAGAGTLESTLRASWWRTAGTIEAYGTAGVEPRNHP